MKTAALRETQQETIYDRLRKVRKLRDLTQTECAEWFPGGENGHLSVASFGRKEKGGDGGFAPDELAVLVEKYRIDARYLFGQLKTFDEADQTSSSYHKAIDAVEAVLDIKQKLATAGPTDDPEVNKLSERIRIVPELREIVRQLAYREAGVLRVILYLMKFVFENSLESILQKNTKRYTMEEDGQ